MVVLKCEKCDGIAQVVCVDCKQLEESCSCGSSPPSTEARLGPESEEPPEGTMVLDSSPMPPVAAQKAPSGEGTSIVAAWRNFTRLPFLH